MLGAPFTCMLKSKKIIKTKKTEKPKKSKKTEAKSKERKIKEPIFKKKRGKTKPESVPKEKIKPIVRTKLGAEKPKLKLKPKLTPKPLRYFEAVGRRKTAVARIRLFTKGEKEFLINRKLYQNYFQDLQLQQIAISSLKKMNCVDKFRIQVLARGGGLHAQAEAVRHGITRALVKFNPDFRKRLKRVGFLTRDSRMRERKKFGLKRARRAPQWQKR